MKKFLCLIFALNLLVVAIPYASAETEELPLLERYDEFRVSQKFGSAPLTYEAGICTKLMWLTSLCNYKVSCSSFIFAVAYNIGVLSFEKLNYFDFPVPVY